MQSIVDWIDDWPAECTEGFVVVDRRKKEAQRYAAGAGRVK